MAGGLILESKSPNMNPRNILLLLGGLLLGALLGLLITFGDRLFNNLFSRAQSPTIGESLEGFSLQDISGNQVSLADFSGKPLVINFWATWCKPCENEMPLLREIAQKSPNGLQVIGINVEEDVYIVNNFQQKIGINFPILLDSNGNVADQYLINGYPTTFFVDASGVLRAINIGELDDSLLVKYLTMIGGNQ